MKKCIEKSFLTKKELSLMLGLSIFTIDSWVCERREIPFIKMGKRVMFDITDIQRWIEKNKTLPRNFAEF